MPRRLKIRRSEHSEGIKMPKMAKTNSPIASPNRLPKRYFTPDLVSFMVGFEWISHERWGIWGIFRENRVSGRWVDITFPPQIHQIFSCSNNVK